MLCTLCSGKHSTPTEYLPWTSHPALENQAYTPNHQLVSATFEFLGITYQQFQWVAPNPQLSLCQPLLELKHLAPI